ncbi:MAG: hypothetical protein SCM11_20010 [Bacillota bacterium]|nr:hypothetical protein [Bacillota bacterium]
MTQVRWFLAKACWQVRVTATCTFFSDMDETIVLVIDSSAG